MTFGINVRVGKKSMDLDAGFFSIFTSAFRFGEYSFPTQNVHRMFGYFADKPDAMAINLISIGSEGFEESLQVYLSEEIIPRLVEVQESFLEALAEDELNRRMIQLQGNLEMSDRDFKLEGIPIRVYEDESQVSIGRYIVDSKLFRGLAAYSLNGGWMGWKDQEYPEAASRAIDSIKKSKRQLYSGLVESLSKWKA